MAKRRRTYSDEVIQRRVKEGRGFGEGECYKPWITVRDVPSTGRCSEISGWKTNGRIHHLLSELETNYFFILEWSPIVIDIREQFPLFDDKNTYEETVKIAESIGIKHPIVPGSDTFNVLTTDFLITEMVNGKKVLKARTLKMSSELTKKRVIEKYEIERLYWQKRDIEWKLVTEKDFDWTISQNVEFVHSYYENKGLELDFTQIMYIEKAMREEYNRNVKSMSQLSQYSDMALGLKTGKSLSVIRHLIANKVWEIDMSTKINTFEDFTVTFKDIRLLKGAM